MRCNTFFFHIHLMEAENWSPFTVSHRCSTSTRKKHRGRQAMPQLYPHPTCIHTPYQNLCTQLCSTNEAISTLTLIPNRNGTWINMLRAIDVAGRWKIPKNSSLPWTATGDGGLKNWIEDHGWWHPLKWPTTLVSTWKSKSPKLPF